MANNATETHAPLPVEQTTAPIQPGTEASATTQSTPLDEPPPAYEITPTSNHHEHTDVLATATFIEAPPPYCLVDPSKIRNMDHVPHHPHISPVEIIDLNGHNSNGHDQSSRHANHPVIAAWFGSAGSNMDIGTDCTFLMAFIIAFFFNWIGFLAVVCLIPTIAARFGAMSGFGLSVAKWITVMRYREFNNSSMINGNMSSSLHRATMYDPAQNFVFAIVLFAGFFLFIRGLISYIAVKNRTHQQGQTADVFTWY